MKIISESNQEKFQMNLSECYINTTFYHSDLGLINEKAQFKIGIGRHLNIHSFYSFDEFMSKSDL
jgi:hypothetical protein